MRVPSVLGSPVVRVVGVVLIVSAVALALILVFADDSDEGGDSASDPGPLPAEFETDDGWVLRSVGWAPAAQALGTSGDRVYATDTTDGTRFQVVDPAADDPVLSEPEPFGAIPRVERAVAAPSGADLWVAEGSDLIHLDPEGEVIETIALDFPSSIDAVTDDAVWLTVTGLPVADESGVVAPRSLVQRVDAVTGEVVAVPVDDPVDFHLAVDGDRVWATVGATLQRLDPVTVEPLETVPLDAPASALVLADDEVLVVVDGESPEVVRVGASTTSFELPIGSVGEAALVEGDDGPELWVLRPDGDEIDRVVVDDGEIRTLDLVAPRRIEVTDDGVWLLGGESDGLVLVARRR